MPKAAAAKTTNAATKAAPKKAPAKRKANGYQMPEPIPLGEVFTDLGKQQWKIGPTIGSGGFGDIYCACKANESTKKYDDYQYVIKVEPHGNGPLFVEMHFYMRNAKAADIDAFRKKRGVKSIGMPQFIGHGSHEVNGKRHRFIVVPRFGSDIWSLFLANDRKMPLHTVYRLAIQMLDVYEYMHECTYVHGDLKGANILLGYGKSAAHQSYLVDFGLASHYTTKDFKPDPKKMHNGTIEYTSRDAHQGVPTMRGDMEILAYNLIQWSGGDLPWEKNKLLAAPVKVQQSKEEFSSNVSARLKECYADKKCPDVIQSFMAYTAKLKYDEKPDYDKCRKEFDKALKAMGKTNSGDLEFKAVTPPPTTKKATARASTKETRRRSSAKYVVIDDSDDDAENISPKPKVAAATTTRKRLSRSTDRHDDVSSPVKKARSTSAKSSTKSRKAASNQQSTEESPAQPSFVVKNHISDTKTKKNKTYNVNIDLDISFDANVIVNVKRKPKKTDLKKESEALDQSSNSIGEVPASDRSHIVYTTKVFRKGARSSPRSK